MIMSMIRPYVLVFTAVVYTDIVLYVQIGVFATLIQQLSTRCVLRVLLLYYWFVMVANGSCALALGRSYILNSKLPGRQG